VSFEFFYQAVAGMYNYALVIRQASNRDVVTHIWSSMKLIVVGVCKSEFKVPCFAVVCIGNGHMQVVWYLLWLKVEDMVWKFLCYGEVWRWSTMIIWKYRWYFCILWFTESGERHCLDICYAMSDFVWNILSYIHGHEPSVDSWHRWWQSIVHYSHIFPVFKLLRI